MVRVTAQTMDNGRYAVRHEEYLDRRGRRVQMRCWTVVDRGVGPGIISPVQSFRTQAEAEALFAQLAQQ